MTNNIAEALNLAVELISAQQAEIQSHNESYQQLATINQQLSNELTTYKQREADAQVGIDRLNALLPSPVTVTSGDSPAPDLSAETVEPIESAPVAEEKLPDPALVPVQIDVPVNL